MDVKQYIQFPGSSSTSRNVAHFYSAKLSTDYLLATEELQN